MTKEEFKNRWESDENGGGLTFDDAADCAIKWGIMAQPRTRRMQQVLYDVLVAAGVSEAEEFAPSSEEY